LAALTQGHQVYCPDARGHGGHTLSVNQEPDVVRLARDLLNLLDYYGLEQAAVVGHSMGALTLWQFIRDFGCQRLSRICIIDQSPKLVTDATWTHGIYGNFDAVHSLQLINNLESDFAESVLRLIANGRNTRARESYERNSSGWQQVRQNLLGLDSPPLVAIWKSLIAADYRDVLASISVPTLLVWGAESNFYTEATAQYLLARIRSASLSCYENADHCPHFKDPQRFADELLQLIDLTNTSSAASTTVYIP
jgi:pimeloyl-ACP methyl ester carboxylesterase